MISLFHFPRRRYPHPCILIPLIIISAWLITNQILIWTNPQSSLFSSFRWLGNGSENFQLSQPGCKIPASPPYFMGNRHPLSPQLENCSTYVEISTLEDNIVRLTQSDLGACCVRKISRFLHDPMDGYHLSKNCVPFQEGRVNASLMEFMVVECTVTGRDPNGTLVSGTLRNFHANVPMNASLREKVKYWAPRLAKKRPPGIFLLVIDSTTRAHAYRNLPKTMEFLVKELGFVDFKGHHPLGEATLVNVAPLLVGLNLKDLIGTYQRHWFDYWDPVPFVWKLFDSLKFITGYFEDLPRIGTFNYGNQRGFMAKPVDLYLRPLMLEVARTFDPNVPCVGRKRMIEFMLDYHFETLRRLSNIPSFLVSWPCWPWHDIMESLELEDDVFLNFFQRIAKEQAVLDSNWLIVISDHGYFNMEYATTPQGLLERRNMPLLIRPPDRILKDQPEILETLRWNSQILTAHFDVHKMLVELATDAGAPVDAVRYHVTPTGQSLLKRLDPRRTCHDAGVPETMCACNRIYNPNKLPVWTVDNSDFAIDKSQFNFHFIQ